MADKDTCEETMDHAWRYFELHANQRMAVFNFFLVLAGLVAAGLAASMQGSARLALLGVILGMLLALVAFIFWKLDQRVSFLVKHAEAAIAEAEASLPIASARLFRNEPDLTSVACSTGNFWTRHWTYGESFRVTFWVMGMTGLGGTLLCALRVVGLTLWEP